MLQYGGNYNAQQAQGYYPSQHEQRAYSPEQHPHGQYSSYPRPGSASPMSQERGHSPYPSQQQYPQGGENASYYDGAPLSNQQGYAPGSEGPDGEKGLGSTLVGGAAGGYLGHQMGGGAMATAGGAVLGAIGANMVNHKLNKPQQVAQPVMANPVVYQAPGTVTTTTTTTTDDGLLGRGRLGGRLGLHRAVRRRRLGLY